MNINEIDLNNDVEIPQELDLFSEEMDDRFNAGLGSSVSTAGTAGSSVSTFSSICCGG